MVAIQILVLGAVVFGFFALGGIKGAKAQLSNFGLLGSDFSGQQQKASSGEVVVDNLQSNPAIPIKAGSKATIDTILSAQIIREPIVSKQKLNQNASKPTIKTSFFDTKSGGSSGQIGQTVSSNSSSGLGFTLTKDETDRISKQPFTQQEKADIIALQNRLNRKDPALQELKDSPEVVIRKKREQEALARKELENQGGKFVFSGGQVTRGGHLIEVKGGLFGNPNFALGGKTPEEFAEQQRQAGLRDARIEQARILQAQREVTGQTIISTIKKSGMNQKEFLRGAGVNLNTGDLNAKALARLRERGLV